MDHFAHVALVLVTLGAVGSGCTCDGPTPKTKPTSSTALASASAPPSASAVPARKPRPTHPAPKAEAFTFNTKDGVRIEGSAWGSTNPTAPVVLLVHRLGGTRDEWTPLLERLFPAKTPMFVAAFDLRGHGASTSAKGHPNAEKGKISWKSFNEGAFKKMDLDVSAVVAHIEKRRNPRAWVLVGSDIGANLIVRQAAERKGDVAGVALVSPGVSLRGLDIYKPFGAVLRRPNLLLTATQDTVSFKPTKAMAAMSKTSKLVTFDGSGHGAQILGEKRWEVWDDLADWVEARVQSSASPGVAGSSSSSAASSAPPSASSSDR